MKQKDVGNHQKTCLDSLEEIYDGASCAEALGR
jgi:hypothetical protein